MVNSSLIAAGALAIAAFGLVHNLWALANVAWSISWLTRAKDWETTRLPRTRCLLMLPMFHEETMAAETLDYFTTLCYPQELWRVLVITTPRDGGGTSKVVDQWMAEHEVHSKMVLHVQADASDRNKADQLNRGLSCLAPCWQDWMTPETFVGVYDADSRPDKRVLQELDARAVSLPTVSAYQQGGLYFSRYERLPGGMRGFCVRARPFYNLRFCLYRELPAYHRSVLWKVKGWRPGTLFRSPNHFLGHGEFIRQDLLRRVGGFPPPSADTSLGTVLSYLGEAIGPLSTFDVGQTPGTITSLVRQGMTWYSGCRLYLRDLRLASEKGAQIRPVHLVMAFKRWMENMIWCAGPLALLGAILWGFLSRSNTVATLGAAAIAVHCGNLVLLAVFYRCFLMKAVQSEEQLPELTPLHLLGVIVAYPWMLVIGCAGPLFYYMKAALGRLTGNAVGRTKTPRL